MFTTLRTLFAGSKAGTSSRQQDQSALTLSMKSDRFLFGIAADGQKSMRIPGRQQQVGKFSNLKARMGVFLS
jgi:hypothetical protein